MAAVHDRMPVIVSPAEYPAWLSDASYEKVALRPCPDAAIAIHRVSRAVNNARNDAARADRTRGQLICTFPRYWI